MKTEVSQLKQVVSVLLMPHISVAQVRTCLLCNGSSGVYLVCPKWTYISICSDLSWPFPFHFTLCHLLVLFFFSSLLLLSLCRFGLFLIEPHSVLVFDLLKDLNAATKSHHCTHELDCTSLFEQKIWLNIIQECHRLSDGFYDYCNPYGFRNLLSLNSWKPFNVRTDFLGSCTDIWVRINTSVRMPLALLSKLSRWQDPRPPLPSGVIYGS